MRLPSTSIAHVSISRANVVAVDLSSALPYAAGLAALSGVVAFLATDVQDRDRTRASQLTFPAWSSTVDELRTAPPLPPPNPLPSPSPPQRASPEGEALQSLIAHDEFPVAWREALKQLGQRADGATSEGASKGTLQARITEVRELTSQRRALADMLGLAVERSFLEAGLEPLPSVVSIGPGASLPPRAATLVRTAQQFPGQSARQVRAYVIEAAPLNDPAVGGRFDRVQAAKLNMGCVQFGYFVAQIFRGQAHLDDDAVLSPEEARAVAEQIQRSTREMKSEVAWAAASRRAGTLLGLPPPTDHELGGHELLRDFTVGVQVVSSSQQEEFFASGASEGGDSARDDAGDDAGGDASGDAASAAAVTEMPTAEFIRFNAAGLQAMLAEACLYGWFLWGAEVEARTVLTEGAAGEGATEALLVPAARRSSG